MKTSPTRPVEHLPGRLEPETPLAVSEAAIRYRSLLTPYNDALELMAEFERIEHGSDAVDMDAIKRIYDRLQMAAQKMIVALNDIGDHRCGDLLKAHQQFNRETSPLFEPALSRSAHPILVPLADIHAEMASFVGQKATYMALVGSQLSLPVPRGFVLTAQAFDLFMETNELAGVIDAYLNDLTIDRPGRVNERCEAIRRLILQAPVPKEIESATLAELDQWRRDRSRPVFTAVRSTAIGEDGEVSFAGQFATLLNVPVKDVLAAYKEVLASKYSTGAVLYRMRYGLDDRSTPMAVMVMAMVPAQASGVLYTRNPSLPDEADLQVNAIHGLGEYLMSGDTAPHVLGICRRTGSITTRNTAPQSHWITTHPDGGTRFEPIPRGNADHPPLDDASASRLADWGERLENFFGSPQDVEWAADADRRLYLLQSRSLGLDGPPPSKPEGRAAFESLHILHSGGRKACSGIVTGRIYPAEEAPLEAVPADSILVIPKAAPEFAPTVARVRGVIAAKGSAASHLASVAREFGVPMIVDAGPQVVNWPEGQWVTLYADKTTVYDGRAPAIEDESSRPSADTFESPVRRRLRALSNRITHRHDPGTEPPAHGDPRTLHDILWKTHEFAMETLHGLIPRREKDMRVIRWTEDNAATDFDITDASGSKSTPGERFLSLFWSGLRRKTEGTTAPRSLGVAGYALTGSRSIYITMPMGSHQVMLDVCRPEASAPIQIHLRVAGGAGPYYQRCLQIRLLAEILDALGFTFRLDGARLNAAFSAVDPDIMATLPETLGRLMVYGLGTNRALVGPWILPDLRNAFLASDSLPRAEGNHLPPAFIAMTGNWRQATLNNRPVIVQDGAAVANHLELQAQHKDGRKAYGDPAFFKRLYRDHFLPLAIARDSLFSEGQIELAMNLLAGRDACAGGVAFGYRDKGSYFMLGLDAHNKRIALYEMIHGRRFKRLRKRYPVDTDRWYDIALRVSGLSIHVHLNGVPVMAYMADRSPGGTLGMWAWSDTVVVFDRLSILSGARQDIAF